MNIMNESPTNFLRNRYILTVPNYLEKYIDKVYVKIKSL